MRNPESFLAALPSKAFAYRNWHPLQGSRRVTTPRPFDTVREVDGVDSSTAPSNSNSAPRQCQMNLPTPTCSIKRGYWDRRGNHLTPEGYIVFPPPSMRYPEDLRMYLFENEQKGINLTVGCLLRM